VHLQPAEIAYLLIDDTRKAKREQHVGMVAKPKNLVTDESSMPVTTSMSWSYLMPTISATPSSRLVMSNSSTWPASLGVIAASSSRLPAQNRLVWEESVSAVPRRNHSHL
jgi:hypothetical protein